MQERFSISHKGQELGPFSKDEILQKIKANELTALDFVFVDSKNDWVPLLEFIPAAGGTTRPPESRPPGGPEAIKIAQPPPKPQAPMKAPPSAQAAQKPQTPPRQNPSPMQPIARPPQTAAPQTPPPTQSQATVVSRPAPTAPPIMKAPPPMQASPAAQPMVAPAPVISTQESAPQDAVTAAPVLQVVQNQQPVAKPAAVAAAAPAAATSNNQDTKIEAKKGTISLKGGVGTLELLQYTAGTVRLALLDEKNLGLSLGKPEELVVKAAAASKLVLKGPAELSAGQGAAVTIEAHDKWGNRDSSFNGAVTAMLSNGTAVGEVKLASGRGTIHFSSTKAETVTVKLVDHARTGLDVSSTWQVQYVAGPAARLVIVTPEETVAGQPIKVEVKALDQFGNLATACNDAIHLEVSAAVKTQQPAAKRQAS